MIYQKNQFYKKISNHQIKGAPFVDNICENISKCKIMIKKNLGKPNTILTSDFTKNIFGKVIPEKKLFPIYGLEILL